VKDVAHEGLRLVLTHQTRLPKDLLQTGLRPILMNLADPKRLSVPGLEGLARLLELLTNYFKVEIGTKLLDHFRVIADPNMLRATAYRTLTDNEEIIKLVELVHIFHLLPPTANIFLKDLVNAVVEAETCLESSAPSPLTEPLAKFLNRYPSESVEFFLQRIGEPRHIRTLRNVLLSKHAPSLERELAAQTSSIIALCFLGDSPGLILPGMLICGDLAALSDIWLFEHGYVIDALLPLWHTQLQYSSGTSLDPPAIHSRQITLMRYIFTRALEQAPRIDLLFDIAAIYTHPSVVDVSGLANFLYRHVAMSQSDAYRRNVLLRFLAWFEDPSPSWTHKTVFIRHIINPLLYVTFSRKEEIGHIIDPDIINHIHARIWRPMSDRVVLPTSDDALSIELLHLSSLIVHHCSSLIQDVRKDIIKCAWNYITVEDAVVKQTAYILAARFFEAFDSPAKFILRTWTGLLRPPHTEGRTLIRQALDILAPALPKRILHEPGYPSWAKLTRRMLIEEGHGLSQLIVIYQLVVRHPTLFYSCRELFVPHMVSSLSKLGLQPSSTWETRTLSLDLLDLIMAWERQAKQASMSETATPALRPEDPHHAERVHASPWALPLNHRETIVSYLVRLVVTSNEPAHKAGLIMRALDQLQALIGPNGWSEVTVKLNFFIRALEQVSCTMSFATYV
jgi:transformation/transcription domain-associated protein